MHHTALGLVLCLVAGAPAAAAPGDALVTGLPGWAGPLPSAWFSGFLPVGGRKQLHYVFVEAETSPSTAPLLLWLNGGPGCSSLDGLMYEHGPLLVSHDGTELVRNPHAWSTMANVLYLEAPAGVGFSYSTDPQDYKGMGANQTSTDNLEALLAWFQLFPEYSRNRFYISGESYGGIYVPTLSDKVFRSGKFPQFAGFLVGNGAWGGACGEMCEGAPCDVSSGLQFLYGHGAVSDRLMRNISRTCGAAPQSNTCRGLQMQAQQQSAGLNMYGE